MRPIDADALVAVPNVCKLTEYDETGSGISYNAVPVKAIYDAPTIDAVPVVRCKDCKHRQDPKECYMCFTEVVDIEGGRMYKFTDLTCDNGFCHRGVKEEPICD